MAQKKLSLPEIVSREEWRVAREEFLIKEKQLTRQRDALNAERRRMSGGDITVNMRNENYLSRSWYSTRKFQKMMTITVYKTNVDNKSKAKTIVDAIRRQLPGTDASFDLEDQDKVLRVENIAGGINETKIKHILQHFGNVAEALP